MTIQLTDAEVSWAKKTAKRVLNTVTENNLKCYTVPKNKLETLETGMLGEIACAKYFDIKWSQAMFDTRKNGDISPFIEVRTTTKPFGNLLLNERDNPNKAYVLALVKDQSTVELIGWEYGDAVKIDQNRFIRTQFREKLWILDRRRLRPVSSLKMLNNTR